MASRVALDELDQCNDLLFVASDGAADGKQRGLRSALIALRLCSQAPLLPSSIALPDRIHRLIPLVAKGP
jgi:hypothetical protein